MPGEKEIDAKKLFGEDSVLHVQKPAGISTENLEDYYKRSFQEEEQRINKSVDDEIDDLFDDSVTIILTPKHARELAAGIVEAAEKAEAYQ